MLRLAFNSNFFTENEVDYAVEQLDPDTLKKNACYPRGFKVRVRLENCGEGLGAAEELKEQQAGRDTIAHILEQREREDWEEEYTKELVFGEGDFDDREEMMVANLQDNNPSDASDQED